MFLNHYTSTRHTDRTNCEKIYENILIPLSCNLGKKNSKILETNRTQREQSQQQQREQQQENGRYGPRSIQK